MHLRLVPDGLVLPLRVGGVYFVGRSSVPRAYSSSDDVQVSRKHVKIEVLADGTVALTNVRFAAHWIGSPPHHARVPPRRRKPAAG